MKAARIIGRLMAYRPGLYILNGLLWMGVHGAFIIPGLLVKLFFDSLEGRAGVSLGGALLLIGAFSLARILHIYVSAAADILHRFTMSALVRANAFDAILAKPGAEPLIASPAEALDYLREDAEQVEDSISWTLDVLGSAAFTAAALFTLFRIDARVTLVAFAPLVVVVAVAQAAETRVTRYREAAREASERLSGAMGDAFGCVQAIKVAGAEEHALTRLAGLCELRRKAALKDGVFNQLLDSVYHNTVGIGTGVILLVLAGRVGAGGFRLGDFSLFIFCLSFVSDYTCFWGGFLAHFEQTKVALRRLGSLVGDASGMALAREQRLGIGLNLLRRGRGGDEAHTGAASAAAGGVAAVAVAGAGGAGYRAEDGLEPFGSLSARGLSYLYEGGRGIQDLSLAIKAGELVVVTGRIGSGKTTLLRALQGLLPAAGDIRWNGIPVLEPAAFFIPPRSAYTPQVPALYSDSLEENLRLGLGPDEEELYDALRSAAMDRDLAALPQGLAAKLGPRGVKLSGGQAQRVAAARMFLRRPQLYFIDDMSSALDAATEEELWRRFEARRRESGGHGRAGAACLAVSHRRATLALADRVIVLAGGRVEAEGPALELLDSSAELRRLWG
jgi:ATP-binding cassette, subfamily B, bacterial